MDKVGSDICLNGVYNPDQGFSVLASLAHGLEDSAVGTVGCLGASLASTCNCQEPLLSTVLTIKNVSG